jgi:type II secretory pathway component PulC
MSIRGGNSEGQRLLNNTNVKLKPGDVVIAINGMEIRSAEAGMAMLEDYLEPERLELMIRRDDKTIPVIIDPDAGK